VSTSAPNAPAAGVPAPSKIGAVVLALLINAVPLIGVLYFEWSAINVLVLYWFENFLIAVFTCVRLAVHRRLTRKKGYSRLSNRLGIEVNGKPATMGLIGEYAIAAFGFTLAHGVFVGGIALLVHQRYPDQVMWQLSFDQIWHGVLALAVTLGIELAFDLTHIRGATFAAMRDYAQGRLSRVIVLHLAILGGMFAMAMTDSPMGILYALIALKTLADLLAIAVRGAPRIADAPPSARRLDLADKAGKDKGGAAAFMKKWKADRELAARNAAEDEEAMPEPRP